MSVPYAKGGFCLDCHIRPMIMTAVTQTQFYNFDFQESV